jgi:hypothetical protein
VTVESSAVVVVVVVDGGAMLNVSGACIYAWTAASAAAQRKRGDRAGEWKEASENFGCDVRLVCTSNNNTSGIQ